MRYLLSVLLVLLASCSTPVATPKNSLSDHQNHSEALRRVMHEFRYEMYRHNRSEMERDEQRRYYLLHLAETLHIMSEKIPYLLPETHAADAELRELKERAKTINSLAKAYRITEADEAVEEVVKTCIRCHNRFGLSASLLEGF